MAVSYKKLWKLLIDRDLNKKDLEAMARVSHYTMNKLTHGDNHRCTGADLQRPGLLILR